MASTPAGAPAPSGKSTLPIQKPKALQHIQVTSCLSNDDAAQALSISFQCTLVWRHTGDPGSWLERGSLTHPGAFQLGPHAEAEGVRDLPPGEELVEVLRGAVAAAQQRVPGDLEGADHAEVVVRRQPADAIPAALQATITLLSRTCRRWELMRAPGMLHKGAGTSRAMVCQAMHDYHDRMQVIEIPSGGMLQQLSSPCVTALHRNQHKQRET